MNLLNKPLVRLSLIILFAVFFNSGCTTIKYPKLMDNGKVAYASYSKPTFPFYDTDFEFIIILPDGTQMELRKKDTTNAEEMVSAAIKAAVAAGVKGASGGIVGN